MTELLTRGYQVLGGPLAPEEMSQAANAYDRVLASEAPARVRQGSTSIRFGGLAAIPLFSRIYLHQPLLDLAHQRIGRRFKLSSFSGRTLRPHVAAPPLHQDVKPGADGDPLVAFIFMVDDFTVENGATRFLPGSHGRITMPSDIPEERAVAPAGSLVVFDGTIWHEHGSNLTDRPRRSIQGYFVRHDHEAAVCWANELRPEHWGALTAKARELLAPPG